MTDTLSVHGLSAETLDTLRAQVADAVWSGERRDVQQNPATPAATVLLVRQMFLLGFVETPLSKCSACGFSAL